MAFPFAEDNIQIFNHGTNRLLVKTVFWSLRPNFRALNIELAVDIYFRKILNFV